MTFNTALFLFLFLPLFLVVYLVAQPRLRVAVALVGSLLFYAWGQAYYLPLMAGLILLNFALGRRIPGSGAPGPARAWLISGIALNIGILLLFKLAVTYGTAFLGPLEAWLPERVVDLGRGLAFPLGLSYISFQLTAYLIDVSGGRIPPERDLLKFSAYVLLFPKLIVGPIVRYQTVSEQLAAPAPDRHLMAEGVRRFLQGLAKKILIADVLATLVTAVFGLPEPTIAPGVAWLALSAYALQIYFDFSGFTDMAVGLGMLMGFRLTENFNYPYISESIGDFWRRWHISLSSWFRDYVFFPLERRRLRVAGQQVNILIVFLLTGLWHGIAQTFVLWGLLHGVLLVLESLFLGRWLQRAARPVRHLYALPAILLTWLVFRSPSPEFALAYLARLAGSLDGLTPLAFSQSTPLPFIEPSFWLAFGAGLLFALPVAPAVARLLPQSGDRAGVRLALIAAGDVALLMLFVLSVGAMAGARFLPGIYAGF
jgi:alginate O-acetyltransferase complex protein AlgI